MTYYNSVPLFLRLRGNTLQVKINVSIALHEAVKNNLCLSSLRPLAKFKSEVPISLFSISWRLAIYPKVPFPVALTCGHLHHRTSKGILNLNPACIGSCLASPAAFLSLHFPDTSQRKFSAFKGSCDQPGPILIIQYNFPIVRFVNLNYVFKSLLVIYHQLITGSGNLGTYFLGDNY